MPDHLHILIQPQGNTRLSDIVRDFKKGVAFAILQRLSDHPQNQLLGKLRRESERSDERRYSLWQRKYFDFNVFSEKKLLEKLSYIHQNPIARGLVKTPDLWKYSSFRNYDFQDASVISMDRLEGSRP